MDEQLGQTIEQSAEAVEEAVNGGAAETAAEVIPPIPENLADVSAWTQYFQDNSELLTTYAMKVVGVFVVLFVAWIVAGWFGSLLVKGMRRARIDETLTRFTGRTIRWVILLLAVLGCLGMFGVNVTSFSVILGAAGLAIGLAFQGSLSNFAAGVMLLVFRPFKVTDFVKVAGEAGTIDQIGLFTTSMDTPDNRRLILPNSAVFGANIENVTHHPIRRVDVPVGVEYSADIETTRQVLTQAAAGVHDSNTGKDAQIVLVDLGASSVDWVVRIWVNTGDYWPKREALIESVKKSLDNAGIGIPFPQMDVHLDQPA